LNVTIMACQATMGLVYMMSFLATRDLPTSLRSAYTIYNDIQNAPARPLLPYKYSIGTLRSDVSMLSNDTTAAEADMLVCGAAVTKLTGYVPPVDIPRWALPTNSTGLDTFMKNQVRMPVWTVVVQQVCVPLMQILALR
jgi:hypothetical protein